MSRPLYTPALSRKAAEYISGAWGPVAQWLDNAVSAARADGCYLSPDLLAPYVTHALEAERLTALNNPAATLAYRRAHSVALEFEERALKTSRALAGWAKADTSTADRIAATEGEKQRLADRERFAVGEAARIRDEEEAADLARRLDLARKRFDAQHPARIHATTKPTKGNTPKKDGPHAA